MNEQTVLTNLIISIIILFGFGIIAFVRISFLNTTLDDTGKRLADLMNSFSIERFNLSELRNEVYELRKAKPKTPDFQGALDSVLGLVKKQMQSETDTILEGTENDKDVRIEELELQSEADTKAISDLLDKVSDKSKVIQSVYDIVTNDDLKDFQKTNDIQMTIENYFKQLEQK